MDTRVMHERRLSGGCVGDVRLLKLERGPRVVAKLGDADAALDVEARMLRLLQERSALPVPDVLIGEPDLLVMTHVEHDGRGGPSSDLDAADHLAALHDIEPEHGERRYGLDFDARIGGLHQPNGWLDDWPHFYAERRLVPMAEAAHRAGGLDAATRRRVEGLGGRIHDLLGPGDACAPPGLVHGDVWSGNVLMHAGRVAAFIDPACYHADPEIELAFVTLFSTFGKAFFERYVRHRPIREGFWDRRRPVYLLYPLLVHARLFGGHYGASVGQTLDALPD
ncbi:MAG: fructosamine kinase family protein [Planctomycetota bacterium]